MNKEQSIIMKIWGKSSPYHPLICHMLDVGCMAEALLKDSIFSGILSRLVKLFQSEQDKLLKLLVFVIALHDIGKCHPLFQQKQKDLPIVIELDQIKMLQPGDRSSYYHEEYALLWIMSQLEKCFSWEDAPARLLGEVMSHHHQRLLNTGFQSGIDEKQYWNDLQEYLTETIFKIVAPVTVGCTSCAHHDEAGTLLLGVTILADWLASNPDLFPPIEQIEAGQLDEYYQSARTCARKAVQKLGFAKNQQLGVVSKDFCDIWPEIPRQSIRCLQESCEILIRTEAIPPGLLLIEAPMGEGKTEAALYVALHWMRMAGLEGAYIALPTAATSNQMYGRVEKFLKDRKYSNSVRLLHAMAWLIDEKTPIENLNLAETGVAEVDSKNKDDTQVAAEWFRPVKRGLLAPWAVGTVDQAMMAALRVRYGVLRWAGLCGKVLILDEIHAYDDYMMTIIGRLLNWCGVLRIPVILLSATLPSMMRKKLIKNYSGKSSLDSKAKDAAVYPLLTHVDSEGKTQYFSIPNVYVHRQIKLHSEYTLGKWDAVAAQAVKMVENGGCLGIIVNTVADAQSLYLAIKQLAQPDLELKLFHARFKAGRREKIEKDCLKAFDKRSLNELDQKSRPKKAILVASQVVEQSLDLDFDLMISAIAPIDLLLQRLGRLHRHGGRIRPETLREAIFYILMPDNDDFGVTGKVYEPWILHRTVKALRGMDTLHIPEQIRELVEFVYCPTEPTRNYRYYQEWEELKKRRSREQNEAKKYLIPPPRTDEFWMSNDPRLFNDDEEGGRWFAAKTRLGDDTRSVLLVDEAEAEQLKAKMKDLSREEGRMVLKNMVALRAYLIDNMQADGDFAVAFPGWGLLNGNLIIPMRDGRYLFRQAQKLYEIVDDPELGVLIERKG
jgi:CRISPR-associated endonuclease/helicase Cas3